MGRGLVGHEVEPLAASRPGRLDLGRIADERDRGGLPGRRRRAGPRQGLGRIVGQPIDVADVEPPSGAFGVDLDGEAHPVVHRHGQRLRATHAAEPGGQGHGPPERATEVLAGGFGEGLERPLQDALGADVDPRPGGHLAVHHQALALELAEVVPRRPFADEVRVGDEHARRPRVGAQDADGLAALDQEGLVVGQRPQLADDRIERVPAARRPASPAIDDEVVGILGHLGVEVVHEHPQGRFLRPAATGQLGASRGPDWPRAAGLVGSWLGHGRQATPSGRPRSAPRSAAPRRPASRRGHRGRADGRGRSGCRRDRCR